MLLFSSKKRCEPKEYKEIIFYKSRYLVDKDITIKTLNLLDISRLDITAQALIQYNINGKSLKKKKIVHLPLDDIEGIVLGAGKNARFVVYGGGILGGLIAAILII